MSNIIWLALFVGHLICSAPMSAADTKFKKEEFSRSSVASLVYSTIQPIVPLSSRSLFVTLEYSESYINHVKNTPHRSFQAFLKPTEFHKLQNLAGNELVIWQTKSQAEKKKYKKALNTQDEKNKELLQKKQEAITLINIV